MHYFSTFEAEILPTTRMDAAGAIKLLDVANSDADSNVTQPIKLTGSRLTVNP